jgi:predicted Rossmann fold flavoprotein
MERYDVIVVGGGPSGIMAAGRSAARRRRVLLVERKGALGAKLLISGKGRCNLTNVKELPSFIEEFGPCGKFLHNCFSRFFNKDLMEFFEARRLRLKVERGGRVFPVSDDAREILKVLRDFLKDFGVEILYNTTVRGVSVWGGSASGVETSDGRRICAPKVVLATGGLSYPKTGSTGIGHRIAKKLGHTVITPRPALVPVEVEESFVKDWQGVSLKNVSCAVYAGQREADSRFGEMLFTHFGLSGPIILDLSKRVGELLSENKKVTLRIDFKPALAMQTVEARLLREFSGAPNKAVKNIFRNLLPARLVDEFLKVSGVDGDKKANQVTRPERGRIASMLKDFRFTTKRTRPIGEAIITSGGVSTREVDPKTMESKLIKGLYIVGELLDVDGPTGGYNLQAAFSTGYACGDNI